MKVHFIAIGGSVMHQLALELERKGYDVTGSDDEIFDPALSALEKAGIAPVALGWDPARITSDLDAVILGMHAREDNPELVRARTLGLAIYSFPEYIFQESRNKTRIVVGGSHGKTTTTSMILHVLRHAKIDFDYLVGARLEGFDRSVHLSEAPIIVCEGDEYPASALEKRPKFHFLAPHIAILTGIAWDHINVFPTWEGYLEQFRIFLEKIEPGGLLIYNDTDPVVRDIVRDMSRGRRAEILRLQPYGLPDHEVAEGRTTVKLEGFAGALSVFGEHNLLNLHAAWFVCKELGVGAREFVHAIGSFQGAAKRLEVAYQDDSCTVFRDFAHAPSKVRATIRAVRDQFPSHKLYAALELHTYSSLQERFLPEYADTLEAADEAAVFYTAHALELKRLPALDPDKVLEAFGAGKIRVIRERDALEAWLKGKEYRNANFLLMSSGNFDGLNLGIFGPSQSQCK